MCNRAPTHIASVSVNASILLFLGASGAKAHHPYIQPHPIPGPSPLLHPLSIVILILAALGLASTLANMPFDFLAAKPSKPTTAVKATPSNPKIPSSTPVIKPRTWMGFLLIASLAVISLQGPLGLSLKDPLPQGRTSAYTSKGPVRGTPNWFPVPSSLTIESAFYPLLVGAGALFIIFDYCT